MRVFLMNKNQKVLSAEINSSNKFECIYEIINISYAPLSIYNAYYNKASNNLEVLNSWFRGRGIPSFRKDIQALLEKLGVKSCEELLSLAYGLSLSDQYWILEDGSNLTYQDINFFTNDFKYEGYLNAVFSTSFFDVDLYSPNNTTDGMVSKAWILEDGCRKLVKGSFTSSRLEAINEWLSSLICERLGIDFCRYDVLVVDNKLVSVCDNFLNEDLEIITAVDIFNFRKKSNNKSDYEHYVSILEDMGISDARGVLSDMYLVDFLMLNTDRHMKNYGVIRNVNTLKWEKITPIFDTGNSLCCDKSLIELNFFDGEYKFFTNTKYSFNKLIRYIDFERYDFSKLLGLEKLLEEKIIYYNYILGMNDTYIEKVVSGFKFRMELLREAM